MRVQFVGRSWQAMPALASTAKRWLQALAARLVPAAPATPDTRTVLIAKRGMSREYYLFCEILAKANAADMLLDRRLTEWRWQPLYVVQERRRAERRGPVPSTWTNGNFILTRVSVTGDDRWPR